MSKLKKATALLDEILAQKPEAEFLEELESCCEIEAGITLNDFVSKVHASSARRYTSPPLMGSSVIDSLKQHQCHHAFTNTNLVLVNVKFHDRLKNASSWSPANETDDMTLAA